MKKGQMIKYAISSNSVLREDRESNSVNWLSTITQLPVKKLSPTLAYKRLQKHYFLMRAYCVRCIFSYIAWVAASTPLNGEGYD